MPCQYLNMFSLLNFTHKTKGFVLPKSKSSYSHSSSEAALLPLMKAQHNRKGWLRGGLEPLPLSLLHMLSEANSGVFRFSVEVFSSSLLAKMSQLFLELPRTQGVVATHFSNPLLLWLWPGKKKSFDSLSQIAEIVRTFCAIFLYHSDLSGKKDYKSYLWFTHLLLFKNSLASILRCLHVIPSQPSYFLLPTLNHKQLGTRQQCIFTLFFCLGVHPCYALLSYHGPKCNPALGPCSEQQSCQQTYIQRILQRYRIPGPEGDIP